MAYDVTSWFKEQLALKISSPKRTFTIGTSDYSERVAAWPTIKRSWDGVMPQSVTLNLVNEDQAMNFVHTDKTNLSKDCFIKFGFTHPTSGDELITMYSGTIDKARYKGGQCTLTLLDKFKRLSERVMGTNDAPVTFTNSTLPSDIVWTAVTCYGGYSSIQSTSNPDINYTSWLEWALVFSTDNVFMNGNSSGKKITEILKKMARYTNSAIYIEDNKIAFKRFSVTDSFQTSLTNDDIIDIELEIDDEDIINKQYVYGAYDVASRDWGVQVYEVSTSSVNTYGLKEQIEKDESIWYVNSISAVNLAQRIINTAGEPYDRIRVDTTLVAAIRQIGETISIEDTSFGGSIDSGYRIMGYSINLDKGLYSADLDVSQFSFPFRLDISTLDGTLHVLI